MKFTPHIITAILSISCLVASLAPTNVISQEQTCAEVHTIFARGSGNTLGDTYATAFQSALNQAISTYVSTISHQFYELGSTPQGGYQYPAVAVDHFGVLLTTKLSAGNASVFGKSVQQGINELKSYIQTTLKSCPQTKFILTGYSQGAMVISKALPDLNPNQILYAATFGDPKLYLPEGYGSNPPACQGYDFSAYRVNVPDCYTAHGILGALKPYLPANYNGKLGTWCNEADFMCGSYFDFSSKDNLLRGHTAYSTDSSFDEASRYIAQAISLTFPHRTLTTPAINTTSGPDVVFLIDATGSMHSIVKNTKAHALKMANKVIAQGGRIALYEYRDLTDSVPVRQLCDFSCTLSQFETQLNSITFLGGGLTLPESVLSSSLYTLNTLNWRYGANKSLVLMTDDTFHNPDLDGTTLQAVVRRSLEIDPVNFYIFAPSAYANNYAPLVNGTSGKFYNIIHNANAGLDDTLQRTLADQSGTTPSPIATITDLIATPNADLTSAQISFNTANTAQSLITVNDLVLGFTTESNLQIEDLTAQAIITVTPISDSGRAGKPATVSLGSSRGGLNQSSTSLYAPPLDSGFVPKAPNAGAR